MKWMSRILLVFLLSALPMTGAFAHQVGAAGSELSVLPATGDFFAARHADAALSTLVALPPRDTHCATGNDAAGHDCGHACCTVACGLHCGALPSAFHFSPNAAAACAPPVPTDAAPASLTHAPPWRPPIA
ncbi:hypothetical protein FAZ95_04350 [Trinickia violacea]|uniref:CopL family metal-binding regulatory protein n=1 Tax=Trinickia violacea TaxID=2571746 RepID=A0A4P8IL63_9BURK|nr:hypothetical protein [Trinickia violacea]QCP48487.1 hypothetical protein FAZ95_04350 [Trinickia violacea]